jgi:hypothetical protein
VYVLHCLFVAWLHNLTTAALLSSGRPPPGPLDLEIVDGADHFFDGIWDIVAEKVLAWIQKQTDRQQPGAA